MLTASDRLVSLGRMFLAIGLIAWGIQHLVSGDFVTRVVPAWPDWLPARTPAAYLIGAFLLAAGAAILLRLQARVAALAFGLLALLSFFLLHLPLAASGPLWSAAWTGAGKALVMWAGAMCVVLSLPDTHRGASGGRFAEAATRDRLLLACRLALAAFLVLCGIQHFKFAVFVATLIPAWIPGALFWTYFAGVALIAGGVGLLVPRVTRLAALLTGAMIFSWVFLVHLPLVLRDPHNAGDLAAIFEALAFSGVAFMIAGLNDARTARRGGRVF